MVGSGAGNGVLWRRALSQLLVLWAMLFAPTAWAERVALVIGNSAYEVAPLSNPRNDAADVAAALAGMGFAVIRGDDLDRRELFRKVQEFRSALRPGGIGVFFYSGHGVEVAGRNFLMPVDNGRIRTAEDVQVEAFDAQNLIDQMQGSGTRLNVVILDACRDNPLPSRWRSSGNKGLKAMEAEQGTLIAYATRPGGVAADGQGRNSPYTEVLLKHLASPVPVVQLFNRVGLEVLSATGSAQVPWVSTSPVPELSLVGSVEPSAAERMSMEPASPIVDARAPSARPMPISLAAIAFLVAMAGLAAAVVHIARRPRTLATPVGRGAEASRHPGGPHKSPPGRLHGLSSPASPRLQTLLVLGAGALIAAAMTAAIALATESIIPYLLQPILAGIASILLLPTGWRISKRTGFRLAMALGVAGLMAVGIHDAGNSGEYGAAFATMWVGILPGMLWWALVFAGLRMGAWIDPIMFPARQRVVVDQIVNLSGGHIERMSR